MELPVEVIDQILDDIIENEPAAPRLSRCAIFGAKWKFAVEARTFQEIKITNRYQDIQQFHAAFNTDKSRQTIVKVINFDIILPTYPKYRRHQAETVHEIRLNRTAFTSAIHRLFTTLGSWNHELPAQGNDLRLCLNVYSPSDYVRCFGMQITQGWVYPRLDGKFLHLALCEFLRNPGARLLEAKSVTELEWDGRPLHPTAVGSILKALPQLKDAFMYLTQPANRLKVEKLQHRQALASSLVSLSLAHLTHLTLDYPQDYVSNHDFVPGSLCDPNGQDRLSLAIHTICQQSPIRQLVLGRDFNVSRELFFGRNDRLEVGELWPSMEVVTIMASVIAPDGGYFLTGTKPRGRPRYRTHGRPGRVRRLQNGQEPYNPWRNEIDHEKVKPMMRAVTTAIFRMPRLEKADFSIGSFTVRLRYRNPGRKDGKANDEETLI
ncbi:Uu.00g087970.m01.CDS01 [Anthostomella pinea]|uniref:Uu.00g087970.m01.CDS01 n=1 Tax=Anthostomella pinea TaxID=933095 RepID=A0AAI8VMC8_9PEZI|nr:Uu.00g087970.m01.CDS01 [Anthostomella pinea]